MTAASSSSALVLGWGPYGQVGLAVAGWGTREWLSDGSDATCLSGATRPARAHCWPMLSKLIPPVALLLLWATGSTAVALAPTATVPERSLQIIVNASNPLRVARREDVARIFLSGDARWADTGLPAVPVDQSARSPQRREFCRQVLAMQLSRVQEHWIARLRETGIPPPKALGSDQEVIGTVAQAAGGIGYVSGGVVLPSSVRVVDVR
jgi:hypothetical protein